MKGITPNVCSKGTQEEDKLKGKHGISGTHTGLENWGTRKARDFKPEEESHLPKTLRDSHERLWKCKSLP